jgi:hypothetical protein
MSPLKINMLLHYFTRATDYAFWAAGAESDAHAASSAVREAMEFFVGTGLLKSKFDDVSWSISQAQHASEESPFFSITDKGRAMVEHLCDVHVPVCKWVQP